MHKVMVFIDYQNFFISWKWKNRGRKPPFVDYQKLGRLINRQIPLDSEVIKAYRNEKDSVSGSDRGTAGYTPYLWG